jgi:catechol 2,3-dioxygenase-like lactoylglutathione lyase family enzyme
MTIRLAHIDHLVLTVADIEATVAFYARLGMERVTFGDGRTALAFGDAKINLHQAGREFDPKARRPVPGSEDFCLIAETPVDRIAAHLVACGIALEAGPVRRTGATGPILSLYLRDPDGNLVELANRLPD